LTVSPKEPREGSPQRVVFLGRVLFISLVIFLELRVLYNKNPLERGGLKFKES